jgi:hypothetical protein
MGPLCAGQHLIAVRLSRFLRWCGFPRHHHWFRSHDVEPAAPDQTTRPISPEHRGLGKGRGQGENGGQGSWLRGSQRPEHSTDPSWLDGGRAFLTWGTPQARPAIADASRIQETV